MILFWELSLPIAGGKYIRANSYNWRSFPPDPPSLLSTGCHSNIATTRAQFALVRNIILHTYRICKGMMIMTDTNWGWGG